MKLHQRVRTRLCNVQVVYDVMQGAYTYDVMQVCVCEWECLHHDPAAPVQLCSSRGWPALQCGHRAAWETLMYTLPIQAPPGIVPQVLAIALVSRPLCDTSVSVPPRPYRALHAQA